MSPGLLYAGGLLAQTSTIETDVDVACGSQGALCEVLYEWTGSELVAEVISFVVSLPVKLMLIAGVALIVNRLLRKSIRKVTRRLGTATAEHGGSVVTERSVQRAEERADTIGSLLRSLSTALVYGGAFILMLESLGVGVIAVVASAGVLSLAIGFGAQSIVEDLLRGVFMLAEDQFGVGDRVDLGMVNGNVERVTLRTVVLRDPEGTLWHVPNSEIAQVANEAQLSSRATIDIGVSYAADLDEALAVLQRAAEDAAADPDWQEHVQKAPEVLGVEELGEDAVNIRVVVWVEAGERRRFERHLRAKMKQALDAAEIVMPNRQMDIWLREQSAAA